MAIGTLQSSNVLLGVCPCVGMCACPAYAMVRKDLAAPDVIAPGESRGSAKAEVRLR